jgi:hypothetical protein
VRDSAPLAAARGGHTVVWLVLHYGDHIERRPRRFRLVAVMNAAVLNYSNRNNRRFRAFLEAGQKPRKRK